MNLFIQNDYINWLVWIVLVYYMYRTYSRKIMKRRKENAYFLQIIKPITKKINLLRKSKDDKQHKYYTCPKCNQSVRVPKGRGEIVITCPKCKSKFEKRT